MGAGKSVLFKLSTLLTRGPLQEAHQAARYLPLLAGTHSPREGGCSIRTRYMSYPEGAARYRLLWRWHNFKNKGSGQSASPNSCASNAPSPAEQPF